MTSLVRIAAAAAGIVLVIAGLLGFIDNPIVGEPSGPGPLFVTGLSHDLVHIALGTFALVIAYLMRGSAQADALIAFGLLNLTILIGTIIDRRLFGLFEYPVNAAEQILHAALAVLGLVAGWVGRGREATRGVRVQRYEEELAPTAVPHEVGEVVVTKRVVEEMRTIEVPVRHEEVSIERREVGSVGPPSVHADDAAFSEEPIRVPLIAEDIEIHKVPRVVEEIEITKTLVEELRQVEDTVRREEVDIAEERIDGSPDTASGEPPRSRD